MVPKNSPENTNVSVSKDRKIVSSRSIEKQKNLDENEDKHLASEALQYKEEIELFISQLDHTIHNASTQTNMTLAKEINQRCHKQLKNIDLSRGYRTKISLNILYSACQINLLIVRCLVYESYSSLRQASFLPSSLQGSSPFIKTGAQATSMLTHFILHCEHIVNQVYIGKTITEKEARQSELFICNFSKELLADLGAWIELYTRACFEHLHPSPPKKPGPFKTLLKKFNPIMEMYTPLPKQFVEFHALLSKRAQSETIKEEKVTYPMLLAQLSRNEQISKDTGEVWKFLLHFRNTMVTKAGLGTTNAQLDLGPHQFLIKQDKPIQINLSGFSVLPSIFCDCFFEFICNGFMEEKERERGFIALENFKKLSSIQ
ncbi:MAG: hypothetical protein CMO81_05065 [Waddliaceae bacterium]|nr:hypothetical protein [Waddliaceae bacterium]